MYVEMKDINKTFDGFHASRDVSFGIEKGHLAALLGPSGSGKTTILRMIAGLDRPDDGDILVEGKRINEIPGSRRGIGFVFQNYALFRYMTVEKNIAFGLEIQKKSKKEIKERVDELLELTSMKDLGKRYPHQLSGGQRQRVAFARALAPNPHLLLLDEPFAAIDAKVRRELRNWLKEMIGQVGVTSIFVTHDQEEAMSMSDRILVLNHGALEQAGSPIDIYTHPATRFAAEFVGQSNFIDDQRMFRPEFAEIIDLKKNSSSNHSLIFSARVEQTEYIGGRWLIDVSVGDKHWRLAHSAPQTIGSQIHIAVNPAGIVTISG